MVGLRGFEPSWPTHSVCLPEQLGSRQTPAESFFLLDAWSAWVQSIRGRVPDAGTFLLRGPGFLSPNGFLF